MMRNKSYVAADRRLLKNEPIFIDSAPTTPIPAADNAAAYIGQGVTVRGELEVPGEVFINGIFEGTLTAIKIVIGETGQVSGNTTAEIIHVYGSIERKLVALDFLNIHDTGSVFGDVVYASIQSARGSKLQGTIERRAMKKEPEAESQLLPELPLSDFTALG